MSSPESLFSSLETFARRVNAHERLPKLLKTWNPTIVVEARDLEQSYSLLVRDQRVAEVVRGAHDDSHLITVQGDGKLLESVFDGSQNPTQAVLDGELVVYGSEIDQVKLDAITLVLWGANG